MSVTVKKVKVRRSKKDLAHNISGHGKGRWHSRTVLFKSKMKARRKHKTANASRRVNRGQ